MKQIIIIIIIRYNMYKICVTLLYINPDLFLQLHFIE